MEADEESGLEDDFLGNVALHCVILFVYSVPLDRTCGSFVSRFLKFGEASFGESAYSVGISSNPIGSSFTGRESRDQEYSATVVLTSLEGLS